MGKNLKSMRSSTSGGYNGGSEAAAPAEGKVVTPAANGLEAFHFQGRKKGCRK
jgi:hypothetical protein